jgi:hypothetical protein
LQRAVVAEVIHDPAVMSAEVLTDMRARYNVSDPNRLASAPRNSIIAIVIDEGAAKRDSTTFVCLPLFPPHLCLPVKVGEQVWIINETAGERSTVPRWICRVPEIDAIDDVNYTHADRRFESSGNRGTAERAQATEDSAAPPGFPNGTNTPEGLSLPGNNDTYNVLWQQAYSTPSVTPEPVPRFTKRPGDMAIQGSNNTLICLGQDRGIPATGGAPDVALSNATTRRAENQPGQPATPKASGPVTNNSSTGRGAIDIVAGRGANPRTAAETITNEREFEEVDKTPEKRTNIANQLSVPAEGDPDFQHDLSRVYVTMQTDIDSNLALEFPNPRTGATVQPVAGDAAVIIKSNHARVVARQDGSIRIVKEGVADSNRAVIIMEADGTVMIDGPKVVIGSGAEGANGAGDQVFIGAGATESIVLGDVLRSLLDEFCTTLATSTGNLNAPIPQVISAATTLQSQLQTILSKNAKTR